MHFVIVYVSVCVRVDVVVASEYVRALYWAETVAAPAARTAKRLEASILPGVVWEI